MNIKKYEVTLILVNPKICLFNFPKIELSCNYVCAFAIKTIGILGSLITSSYGLGG